MGEGGGGIRTPRSLPMDPRLQLKCLSFVTHGEDLPEILVKPLPKNPTNSTYGWYASFKNAWVFPGISRVPRRPLLPHCLGKSRWVKSQLTEEFRIDWAENAWEPGITRGTTSCQRSQNVETLLTIQYHLSLRFHFRFRYLLLDLLLLRWTEKAWLESLPAVLDSTWNSGGNKSVKSCMSRWNMIVQVSFLTRRLSAHNYQQALIITTLIIILTYSQCLANV